MRNNLRPAADNIIDGYVFYDIDGVGALYLIVMADRLPRHVRPSDDVISQMLQDDIVLLNLNSQQYYGLDSVGAHAWTLLAENGDVSTVAERLCLDYSGDPDIIRRDFYDLVAELIEAGLLRTADI